MRVGSLAAVVLGLTALAATAGAMPAAHQATQKAADPATQEAVIVVRPGVIRIAATAQAAPLSTAACERDYGIASYGSPTIRNDLAVFDRAYHLPAPPKFQIIRPAGRIPGYDPASSDMVGWAGETTLDVEWAHAVAPGANLLLVETPVSETEGVHGFPQIMAAEKYVLNHHLGDVISQSFSATEETFPGKSAIQALRGAYELAAQDHVTVLTASGDSGAADVGLDQATYYAFRVTSWPDSDPLVTGVGGTQLHFAANGAPAAPTVWNDTYNPRANVFTDGSKGPDPLASGGGLSIFFTRPAYQDGVRDVTGGSRGVPDISMSAACDGAVDTYSTFAGAPPGWSPECGTSEATPLFAGVVALADQAAGHSLGLINPALYQLAAARDRGITDVTAGNNTVSFTQDGRVQTVTGFTAGPGYNLATGLGTVNAPYFVTELANFYRTDRGSRPPAPLTRWAYSRLPV